MKTEHPSDFWGPKWSYCNMTVLQFLGEAGKRGAEAGLSLRKKLLATVKE